MTNIINYNETTTNIIIQKPINPDIGYIIPTKFAKPSLARGIALIQNRTVIKVVFLLILLINPNPLAKAVVNIAIQSIIEYSFL